MCSSKILIVAAALAIAVMAQQDGMQRSQQSYGGEGGFGGNQGGFGGQGGNQGAFGGNGGGFGGQDGRGGQGVPPLPFLKNVSEQARREYMAIVTNSTLTISEIEEQSTTWAETNGVSEQYSEFTANVTAKLEELKQNVTSVLTNLSSVLNSLETILENEDQTVAAQKQAIEELRQENPEEVDALFFIAQEVAPKPGRGGNHGGQNGGFTGQQRFSDYSTTTV
ncbi:SXP/RAL-2 family protein Ani s 5-like cation-binding domain-containing protein [Caenorhabditis elegans]|uniref:SXP/RAL-2 family protein Ani s 5-like cation-binding domain-containing protein n=1 Tax=Caenorhabditis elegans TaxID=6239 RepID=A1Z6D0_CAEEL|nr:SXP/RAL-2 family protein Ani s 5-like cation-binding domain-containing protein [Caenorhabditis elegans]CAM06587.1 SXP/RAL-2 family protein Ani s 5-like cation-binding domain-containing protein [Caenorhabditis elegans]|eukprot:NP_001076676.1 Uncharacterized protein CELE_F13E9.14 [Caenorhabditis elegans]